MIVSIPAVTEYISNSRKSAYISTAKEVIGGARNLVNEGKLEMYDPTVTYYIPSSYIQTENGQKSPYGEFTEAYIGVTFDSTGYNYYWISNDTSGQGVKEVTEYNDLDEEDIVTGIKNIDVRETIEKTGIDGRNRILILNSDGTWEEINLNTINSVVKTIDTCPNCKFLYTRESYITTWNSEGDEPSIVTSDLSSNYEEVISQSGKSYFLGVVLNSSNQITRAYACGLKGDVPFCIEGYHGNDKNNVNRSILDDSNL